VNGRPDGCAPGRVWGWRSGAPHIYQRWAAGGCYSLVAAYRTAISHSPVFGSTMPCRTAAVATSNRECAPIFVSTH
jgi:hypothetical protein